MGLGITNLKKFAKKLSLVGGTTVISRGIVRGKVVILEELWIVKEQ